MNKISEYISFFAGIEERLTQLLFSSKKKKFFSLLSVTAIFESVAISAVHYIRPTLWMLHHEIIFGTLLVVVTLCPIIWLFISKEEKIIATLQKNEKTLTENIKEKESLLKEVHHRVRNNLQVISSLLRMQMQNSTDDNIIAALKTFQHRIKAMAGIHERLFQSPDFTKIDFENYISEFTNFLLLDFGLKNNGINLNIEAKNISFDIGVAIPCGLIINELVSNSLLHAFPEHKGNIHVKVVSSENLTNLTVSDDGCGIPTATQLDNLHTIGLQIVEALADQLEGTIQINRNHGTECKISFATTNS